MEKENFESLEKTMPPKYVCVPFGFKAYILEKGIRPKVETSKTISPLPEWSILSGKEKTPITQEKQKMPNKSEWELKESMFTSPQTYYGGYGAEHFIAPDLGPKLDNDVFYFRDPNLGKIEHAPDVHYFKQVKGNILTPLERFEREGMFILEEKVDPREEKKK